MAKLIVSNPFSSIQQIALTYKVVLPKPREWRMIPQSFSGEVNGCPAMRGVAVATNGIHVAILQSDNIVIGHLDWFVADEQSPNDAKATRSGKMPRENIFEGFSLD